MAYSRPSVEAGLSSLNGSAPCFPPAFFSTRSPTCRKILEQVERFARCDAAVVLLEGESGTGKTFLAQHLHACSRRSAGPFEIVQIASLDDSLASSELFGHLKGSFTSADHSRQGSLVTARGGTVFLDEIGKASKMVQGKLLHVLDRKEIKPLGSDRAVEVDARVVAASNVSLESLVTKEAFLPDLFARLLGFRVEIPPLRKRAADIPDLVLHSVERHATACGYRHGVPAINPDVMLALQRAPWPYNLRQLDLTVKRLLVDAEGADVITFKHCTGDMKYLAQLARGKRKKLDARLVRDALENAKTKAGAARLLGISRPTINAYLGMTTGAAKSAAPQGAIESVVRIPTVGEKRV